MRRFIKSDRLQKKEYTGLTWAELTPEYRQKVLERLNLLSNPIKPIVKKFKDLIQEEIGEECTDHKKDLSNPRLNFESDDLTHSGQFNVIWSFKEPFKIFIKFEPQEKLPCFKDNILYQVKLEINEFGDIKVLDICIHPGSGIAPIYLISELDHARLTNIKSLLWKYTYEIQGLNNFLKDISIKDVLEYYGYLDDFDYTNYNSMINKLEKEQGKSIEKIIEDDQGRSMLDLEEEIYNNEIREEKIEEVYKDLTMEEIDSFIERESSIIKDKMNKILDELDIYIVKFVNDYCINNKYTYDGEIL